MLTATTTYWTTNLELGLAFAVMKGVEPGLFTGRIASRGSDRVRVTRPRPVTFENLLTRPDPTREISQCFSRVGSLPSDLIGLG